MLRFPDKIARRVGYLMPNSHGRDSYFKLLLVLKASLLAACPSSSSHFSASASKDLRYCKCPARTCQRRIQRKTSLLLVQLAFFCRSQYDNVQLPAMFQIRIVSFVMYDIIHVYLHDIM